MATLDQFLPWVLPSAVNCPTPLAYQALSDAAREFCADTNLIQQSSTQNGVANQASYAITEPTDLKLNQILKVTWEGNTLRPIAADEVRLAAALRGSIGNASVETGTPREYYQRTPLDPTIYLWPVPDAAAITANGILYIKAAFAPFTTSVTVPDDLYNLYVSTIAAGALANLLAIPEQPWNDPKMAMVNRRNFEHGVAQAKRDARVGRAFTSQRVQGRRF